ncbi:MAG: FAD-dependent oxidoreductase [Oscillospiraceae bacterium]|jgi:2,4-dienoyl-CoA reductase-like NADH-dependent reductase (Old Yellow Enzyme family)/thioredoxin reductase|nr:FAD-dependent oxidoreductase [Oscillospiraceae bacterium]
MKSIKYPHLFEPIKLGNTIFKNRIFAAPTGFRDFTSEDFITPDGFAYYERKALGGAASVCVGETCVSNAFGKHGDQHLVLDNPKAANSLGRLCGIVQRHGAVCSAELQHAGWAANRHWNEPGPAYAPVEGEHDGRFVPAMPEEMIEATIEQWARAADFARRVGFGMVTVHAGHGWQLHQWMSPLTNTRKDRWGGSPENRMRLPIAILQAIRRYVGPHYPVEVRISGSEAYGGGYGIEEGVEFARAFEPYVDLIHVSTGNYDVDEVFTVTHPSMFLDEGVNVHYAGDVKKRVKIPVAAVGSLGDPAQMEEIIASGKADVVEMARALIADPDLPNKARGGREDEIRPCLRCLNCFSVLLPTGFYTCSVNPEQGYDIEMRGETTRPEKQRVLVIGGGPAGMQAALTCARRGHEVTLCEKAPRLGGVLRCESGVPFKWRVGAYLDYMERLVSKAAVEVRLNTEVTPEYARAERADVIIAALGGRLSEPPIPAIAGGSVVGVTEAYADAAAVGNSVVVLGGGLAGTELGIYLASLGKRVEVLEMLDRIGDGGNFLHVKALNLEIGKYGVGMNFNTKAVAVTEAGVVAEDASTGAERVFAADTVVNALGTIPLHDEAKAFYDCAAQFHIVGDCRAANNIARAVSNAFHVARDVGRY